MIARQSWVPISVLLIASCFALTAARAAEPFMGAYMSMSSLFDAKEIPDYLQIGKRCGVHGAAIFTWHTLEPYLDEVQKAGYLEQFVSGLPPRP